MEEQNNKAVEEPKAAPAPTIDVKDTKPAEEVQEINWRKFREQRELERKEKEAAEKKATEKAAEAEALKAAMESILTKNTSAMQAQEMEETEEQRINRKVKEALEAQEIEREKKSRQREQAELPNKLTSTFSDFNQVCSSDNLDYLEYHYPEVVAGYKRAPDDFDKWAAIYKAVKRFVPNPDSKKEQSKAEKNMNKPQSMAVGGTTATGDTAPMQLDDKRRADNWKRMQRVMRGG